MTYKIFIPVVNRFDYLTRALECVKHKGKENIIIVDNSDEQIISKISVYKGYEVVTPTVPLNFTQTMNLLQKEAINRKLDFFIFMHNDATATEEIIGALFNKVEEAFKAEKNWGVIFTLYDLLCAYNTKNIKKIGKWDTTFLQYFADNDYFRIMRLKGYKTLEAGNEGVTHNTSATKNGDLNRFYAHEHTFGGYRSLYVAKWGGMPGEETNLIPFGNPAIKW